MIYHPGLETISTMSEDAKRSKVLSIRNVVNFSVVADSILDIADLTIEKYEFQNEIELPVELRERALGIIREALWEEIDRLKIRRIKFHKELIALGYRTVNDMFESRESNRGNS